MFMNINKEWALVSESRLRQRSCPRLPTNPWRASGPPHPASPIAFRCPATNDRDGGGTGGGFTALLTTATQPNCCSGNYVPARRVCALRGWVGRDQLVGGLPTAAATATTPPASVDALPAAVARYPASVASHPATVAAPHATVACRLACKDANH